MMSRQGALTPYLKIVKIVATGTLYIPIGSRHGQTYTAAAMRHIVLLDMIGADPKTSPQTKN